jgi:hypothetical protein
LRLGRVKSLKKPRGFSAAEAYAGIAHFDRDGPLAGNCALRRLLLGSRGEGFAAALAAFPLGIHLTAALGTA